MARRLIRATAVLFALLGAVLFVAPEWAADEFPWSVSPFLTMTMGGWYLGSAALAWEAGRIWHWSIAHSLLIYVWIFGFFQGLLLVVHEDVLDFGRILAWPYVLTLAVAALTAIAGVVDLVRSRPPWEVRGSRPPAGLRVLSGLFVVLVGILALPLVDGYDSPRSIWPGELTLISARGFAVFFAALALSALPLVFARGLAPAVAYVRPAIVLNTLILVAALIYLGQFDFGDHPGQLVYVGLYVFVLVLAVTLLVYARADRLLPAGPPQ